MNTIHLRSGAARALRARLADGLWHTDLDLANALAAIIPMETLTRYAARNKFPLPADPAQRELKMRVQWVRFTMSPLVRQGRVEREGRMRLGYRYRWRETRCAVCNRVFAPLRRDARICSPSCAAWTYRNPGQQRRID